MAGVMCHIDLVVCDTDLVVCDTDLVVCDAELVVCDIDLVVCDSDVVVCDTDLVACDTDPVISGVGNFGMNMEIPKGITEYTKTHFANGIIMPIPGTAREMKWSSTPQRTRDELTSEKKRSVAFVPDAIVYANTTRSVSREPSPPKKKKN